MERERAAVTCDRRLFHRRAAATGNLGSSVHTKRVYPSADSHSSK